MHKMDEDEEKALKKKMKDIISENYYKVDDFSSRYRSWRKRRNDDKRGIEFFTTIAYNALGQEKVIPQIFIKLCDPLQSDLKSQFNALDTNTQNAIINLTYGLLYEDDLTALNE